MTVESPRALRWRRARSIVASGCAVGLFFLMAPPAAYADEPTIQLEWHSAECSSAAEVLDETHRILGGSPRLAKPVDVVASVKSTSTGLRLELTTRIGDAFDERSAEDASCLTLRNAAALMIALAVQSVRANESPSDSPSSTPETPREGGATPSATVQKPPARRPPARDLPNAKSTRPRLTLGGGLLFDVGTLGGLTNGLELRAAVRQRGAAVEVFGTAFLAHVEPVDGDAGAGIRVRLLSGGARACYALACGPGRCEVQLCAGGELIFARGDSFGVRVNLPGRAWWSAWGPGVRLALPVAGPARLSVGVFGVLSIGAPYYALELGGTAHALLHPESGIRLSVGYEFDAF